MATASGRIALGGAQFGLDYGVSNSGGRIAAAEAARLLELAWASGVDMVDLAPAYGDAEQAVAAARPARARFRVVSKTPRLASAGLDGVAAAARRSAALAADGALDALLAHSAADLAGSQGDALWALLVRLRDQGLTRRIGFSAYVEDAPAALAERLRPEVIQVPLSFLDQRLALDGSLERLKALGVEIHVRSVYLQGLAFMAPERLPPKLARIAPRLREIHARIAAAGADPLRAALGFVLARAEADRLVLGATSAEEFQAALAAAETAPLDLDWPSLRLEDDWALTPSNW